MKAHHPAAFMAANLSALMDDTDKVHQLYEDAQSNGLQMLPPDINASQYRFVPVSKLAIRYGLGAIKGTGQSAIDSILKAREEGGPFRDLFEFCLRVDKRIVNRRVLESLIRAGAFDSIEDHRHSLLASAGIAMESAEQASRSAAQSSLFTGEGAGGDVDVSLVDKPRWSEKERLVEEKQALGFYLSGHPFSSYEQEVAPLVRTRLSGLAPQSHNVTVAGVVNALRVQQSRRGRMAVVQLDDGSARIEVTIFNELFETSRNLLKEDQLLVVEGRPQHDDFTGGIRLSAEKVYDLPTARAKFARAIKLLCNGQSNGSKLRELLAPYRNGACPVSVVYNNHHAECRIDLGDEWRVRLDDGLIKSLGDWLRPENVQVIF